MNSKITLKLQQECLFHCEKQFLKFLITVCQLLQIHLITKQKKYTFTFSINYILHDVEKQEKIEER